MPTEIIPIVNEQGDIVIHDTYIDGRWTGSRRTLEQAIQQVGLNETIAPARYVCEGRNFIKGKCTRCGENHWPAEKN